MSLFRKLFLSNLPDTWDSARREVTDLLGRITTTLNAHGDALESGPVPGAYFPVCVSLHNPSGLSLGDQSSQFVNFPSMPRYIALWSDDSAVARMSWYPDSTLSGGKLIRQVQSSGGGVGESSYANPADWSTDMDGVTILDPGIYRIELVSFISATIVNAMFVLQTPAVPFEHD